MLYIHTSFSHLPSNTEVFVSRGREEQFLWGASASTAWIFFWSWPTWSNFRYHLVIGLTMVYGRYNDFVYGFFWWENDDHILYPLVMTNSSPWKNPPFLSSVNHLFLWAMAYHGYVSHNQMVLYQSRHQKNWANQQTPKTFFTPVFWMWNIFVQPGTTVADPVNKTAGFVEFADNRGFDSAMRMREEIGAIFFPEWCINTARS